MTADIPAARPDRRRPLGLLVRLVAVTVLAGVVAGSVGALVQQRSARQALRDEISERTAALAAELAARLDQQLETSLDVLYTVATRQPIAEMGPSALSSLRSVLQSSPTFDELVLYDVAGRPVAAAASRFLATPEDYPVRPAGDEPSMVEVTSEFPPRAALMVPVENPPGTRVGWLMGLAPLEVLTPSALNIDVVAGTTRSVVDRSGRILVHPDRDRVLRNEVYPLAAILADGESTTALRREGQTMLVAAAASELFPAAVVLEQRESAALAPVSDQLFELTLILVLVVLATVLAVSAGGTWLLAPLRPLTSAVSRLGRDERGVRVDEPARGELGELASEFNRMANALDRRRDELDELQRLALLVNTRSRVDEVADEVARGTVRLLPGSRAALCLSTDDHRPPEVLAVSGTVEEGDVLERAATALRLGRTHVERGRSEDVAAVAVPAADGTVVAALVVARSNEPFTDDEVALAEAYAAFAGVALTNAQRLVLEQRLAGELQEAVEARRGFLSSVSHELRTPLTLIEGFADNLLESWAQYDEDRRQDLVAKIRHHGHELRDLVDRLLDFAVTERGVLTAQVRPLALADEVDATLAALEMMLEGRPVETAIEPVEVDGDPTLLRRALSNLLSNAVKYSPAGSPVRIEGVLDGGRVRIGVTDRGSGLSADDAARAFQPFWRAGDHQTRPARGTGLGLALVAEYAKAMGGAAGVTSEPGRGSTFFLVLPGRSVKSGEGNLGGA